MTGPPVLPATWLSAAAPVVLLFALILRGRWSTSKCAVAVLAVTIGVALAVFRATPSVLLSATGKGLWLGLWILGVVWPALLLYRIAGAAGLERIGRVLTSMLPRRLEGLLLLAWVFPSLLQGVAGFGTPIAVSAPLIVAAGWPKVRAVLYPLIGYHWSVTFGSMGSSFYMASLTAHLSPMAQGQFALRAASMLALNCLAAGAAILLLEGGIAGLRAGARMLFVVGVPMAATLIVVAQVVPAVASLASGTAGFLAAVALAGFDRRRLHGRPSVRRDVALAAVGSGSPSGGPTGARPEQSPALQRSAMPGEARVLAPYLYLLVTALPVFLFPASRVWVGQHFVLAPDFPSTVTGWGWINSAVVGYTPFAALAHPGAYILMACLLGYLTYRWCGLLPPAPGRAVAVGWLRSLPKSSVPIVVLAAVATTMTDTGMVSVLARGIAGVTGRGYPALAPTVGWIGSFMSGSTTTSNALFSGLQHQVAELLGIDPTILLAAQTVGGNIGNAVAPVVVVIGLSAVESSDRLAPVLRAAAVPVGVLLAVAAVITMTLTWI